MMIGGVFGHVPTQLSHLQLILEITLETAEQHLTLTRLESINEGWYGSNVVVHGVVYEFLVDKILVGDFLDVVVDKIFRVVGVQPSLTFIGFLVVEAQIY